MIAQDALAKKKQFRKLHMYGENLQCSKKIYIYKVLKYFNSYLHKIIPAVAFLAA